MRAIRSEHGGFPLPERLTVQRALATVRAHGTRTFRELRAAGARGREMSEKAKVLSPAQDVSSRVTGSVTRSS